MLLNVTERKTGKTGTARELTDGRYAIHIEGAEAKELAASTFKRLFTVAGEVEAQPSLEVTPEEVTEVEETEGQTQLDIVERALGEVGGELEDLLKDGEEVDTPQEETPAEETAKPSIDELGLNINLINWSMNGTRGGKTDKVTSQISIKGYLMEVTEYDGYITDVRVFQENENVPENDPDALWTLVYKSPKMSLKDTLTWFGLEGEDMKTARKEITAIRKAVKSAHLAQQAQDETM